LLADLVRSADYGDNARADNYEILLDHPITNGPYGVYAPGTVLAVTRPDHDDAVADTARGAAAVATLVGEPYDKILATEMASGGAVVYWNGNRNCHDWRIITEAEDTPSEDKGESQVIPDVPGSAEGEDLLKNALHWLAQERDIPWIWEDPTSGTVAADGKATGSADIMFTALYTDMTPMPVGSYSATLVVASNAPVDSIGLVPVWMHIVDELAMPALSEDTYECGQPGDSVTHVFNLTNDGPTAGSFDLSLTPGTWTATPSVTAIGPLAAGASQSFEVVVDIPPSAGIGATDSFAIVANYDAGIPGYSDTVNGVTCAEEAPFEYIYLPIVIHD
jgi:hypothetical protein